MSEHSELPQVLAWDQSSESRAASRQLDQWLAVAAYDRALAQRTQTNRDLSRAARAESACAYFAKKYDLGTPSESTRIAKGGKVEYRPAGEDEFHTMTYEEVEHMRNRMGREYALEKAHETILRAQRRHPR